MSFGFVARGRFGLPKYQSATDIAGRIADPVQTTTDLANIPPSDREDKQIRLVEDDSAIFYFDAQALSGDVAPAVGSGFWIRSNDVVTSTVPEATSAPGGDVKGILTADSDKGVQIIGGILEVKLDGSGSVSFGPTGGLRVTPGVVVMHGSTHENGGADELDVTGLSGILADPQVPRQATELLIGGGEIATQTETNAGVDDQHIVTPLKLANTPRLPTQDENNALVGTDGSPSAANPYVTDSDPRVPTQDENNALVGTNGSPTAANPYVTDSDPRNSDARTPTSHAASHQNGGSDEVAVATAAANAIPKALASGDLDWSWIPDTSAIAEATSSILKSTNGYEVATGMTLTEGVDFTGAGTYLVWFASTALASNNSTDANMAIFVNGVLQAASVRVVDTTSFSGFTCMARVAVGAGHAVTGQWNRIGGGTVSMEARQLLVQRII